MDIKTKPIRKTDYITDTIENINSNTSLFKEKIEEIYDELGLDSDTGSIEVDRVSSSAVHVKNGGNILIYSKENDNVAGLISVDPETNKSIAEFDKIKVGTIEIDSTVVSKSNVMQQSVVQSYYDKSFSTKIADQTIEFDSKGTGFTFLDEVNVPELKINDVLSECFTSAEKEKLNKITTPMQVVGRVDSVELLPTDGVIGSVYLVGMEGIADFEEYIAISSYPTTYESLGKTQTPQIQSDWNKTTSTESDYILNKPAIKAGQGENSIIEGDLTRNSSIGIYSHAEGTNTTVLGNYSHAEGYGTTSSGNSSHAEGYGTTASGNQSHAGGYGTTASGDYSHAEGNNTTATGYGSHSEGAGTTASGNYSHTEGIQTIAKNKSQHVFGELNIADPSQNTTAFRGTYIEIVGNGADNTNRSNARTLDWQGNEVLAGNLTIGGTITSNGQQILPQKQSDWNQTTSTVSDYIKNKPAIKAGQGVNSIIESKGTTASGENSHAEGYQTIVSGIASHAEGYQTTASGSYGSHAEGYATTASGVKSHAEGDHTIASGYYSHAECWQTTASSPCSHAEGYRTTASGSYSHSEGELTTASGDRSHAEGLQTIANHKCQHVFGEFNIADTSSNMGVFRGNYVEIVGNGATTTNLSNARTLDWQGNEVLAGTITANGINISDAISTVKLRVSSGTLQASVDGGTTWHTINFAD